MCHLVATPTSRQVVDGAVVASADHVRSPLRVVDDAHGVHGGFGWLEAPEQLPIGIEDLEDMHAAKGTLDNADPVPWDEAKKRLDLD